jgi:putative transposase
VDCQKPGWYSRGYLPDFDAPDRVQSITFHLADSLPASALDRITAEIKELPEEVREVEKRNRLDKWLDRGIGECWLGRAEIANLVEDALLAGDGDQYLLLAWSVMPNHLHVVAEFSDTDPVWKVVKKWKGGTATHANRIIGRQGAFWFRDYWDRYIRNEAHLRNAIRYVSQNPVKAALCARPEDWPFGSARRFL